MTEKFIAYPEEPTDKEKTEYFYRFGLRLRDFLKILQEFKIFGRDAKDSEGKKQWFIAYRDIVEAAFALKLAELLDLPSDERRSLLQASMTHRAGKRGQKEAAAAGVRITADEYDAIQNSTAEKLLALGVDQQAIHIARAVGTNFKRQIERGELRPTTPEEKTILKLRQYLAYIENCVDQPVDSPNKKYPADIIDWRKHLTGARARYPHIRAHEFNTETRVTGAIERKLRKTLAMKGVKVPAEIPLWKFLRNEIATDIRNGVLPKVKSSEIRIEGPRSTRLSS